METTEQSRHLTNRRSFMLKGAAVGAGAYRRGRLLADLPAVSAHGHAHQGHGRLTKGDVAILRFLAAAEILEADLWQQYNELGGIQDSEVPGGSGNPAYTEALAVLDEDMDQYIHDNTDDEQSHANFINAYLEAHGADPINLDPFRTLPSSQATGAQQIGRLTNLMQLTRRHQLLDAIPQRLAEPRPRRHPAAGHPRPGRRPAPGDSPQRRRPHPARPPAGDRQHRRLPLRLHRTGRHEPLRRARPAGHATQRCCASCSASAAPRSCTSRPGKTKPATRRP